MRIPRLYYPTALNVATDVILDPETTHYLQQVLRLRLRAKVILFNGQGGEYSGELVQLDRKNCVIHLENFDPRDCEAALQIHLGQGLCRPDRMDLVLQKATELGVTSITPLITEYSSAHLAAEKFEKRNQRWQRILASACEQCGRNKLPIIKPACSLAAWQVEADLKFICHPDLPATTAVTTKPNSIAVCIGSEGGFSEAEVASLSERQFIALPLGPRILRTETAALAALTILQCKYGDLN